MDKNTKQTQKRPFALQVGNQLSWIVPLLLIIILLLSSCDALGSDPEAGDGNESPTTSAEQEAQATRTPAAIIRTASTILAEGQLVAANPQLPLAFTTNGRLLDLHVQTGDTVAEGDLLAALDDESLQDALVNAELGRRQAQNSLDQNQLSLDKLLNWQPDDSAVAQAEANIAAAESGLENAQSQDSVAYSNITSARIRLEQAQRNLERAQKEYETAFDAGREWELYIDDPSCRTGEQHPNCTGQPYSDKIKAERDYVQLAVPNAEDDLAIAQAAYNLAVAGLNDDSAVGAEASIASARQALDQALSGPKAEDIAAARLQVEQAQLSMEQAEINLANAQEALPDAQLFAPTAGTVLSLDALPGAFVGAGTPVVTLLNTADLQFQTSNFSERDLAQIAPGQAVVITLKSYPNDALEGQVLRVAPVAQGTLGDAATFTVIITLAPTDLDLLPGMTGRVEISSNS